jgi:sugar phosphate isomerase/epimerase
MHHLTRRGFIGSSFAAAAALSPWSTALEAAEGKGAKMRYGLVTYQWGKDWDLPTLIANCRAGRVQGVELRTTHAHGVEPSLNAAQRADVKKRFADSGVVCVGPGSDERFDNPDPAAVTKAIEATKAFVKLSHDIGSTGVKVKPDRFWPNVPREQTIEQIGKSLNECGRFAAEHGQQIRLEVHGQCAELPMINAIMDVADHRSVAVCWNGNAQDLAGEGLKHNFNLVKDRMGATAHTREFDAPGYPWAELIALFVGIDYDGYLMIEASTQPADRVAELKRQRELFDRLVAEARGA